MSETETTSTKAEQHSFEAEVQQLLNIVIHSLYTDKEIFIRELISNASDALEKLRHIELTEKEIVDNNLELEIKITADEDAGTITFQDFGVGMARDELVQNLGTIAHSGSKAFLKALEDNKDTPEAKTNLIGQFGVGFYSAFMVADEVKVYTRSWQKDAPCLLWSSKGSGSYSIEEVEGERRGCKIVLTLKEDCKDFAKKHRIQSALERYSSYVNYPILLEDERINKHDALWLRSKNEIKEEEYTEFYKFQGHAFDEPLTYLHFSSDVPLTLNALLFVPTEDPERFSFGQTESSVALHCRKVLVDATPKGLLPDWLRFIKGVVDSADLPLNISRESMQDSALVQKINRVLTKRLLKKLEDDAKKKPEIFDKFYTTFSKYLKEGITRDFGHRDQLAKLIRYESSYTEAGKTTSFEDYISRAKEEQKEIYYLHAPNRATIENGPYLEAFKARGLEVLFVYETMDEFVMSHLGTFEEKKLVSADQADIELEDVEEKKDEKAKDKPEALPEETAKSLAQWFKDALGDRVDDVIPSKRLVDSPALALNTEKGMTPSMRRAMNPLLKQENTTIKAKLEINPSHPLIQKLETLRENDETTATLIAEQILDNALITAGYLEQPRTIVPRLYTILEQLAGGGTVPVSAPAQPSKKEEAPQPSPSEQKTSEADAESKDEEEIEAEDSSKASEGKDDSSATESKTEETDTTKAKDQSSEPEEEPKGKSNE